MSRHFFSWKGRRPAIGKACCVLVLLGAWQIVAGDSAARTGPEIQEKVDLRQRFFDLGLHTRNQGRHPSCAVFAILGAVEYHSSFESGQGVSLSENYLLWATRQVNPQQEDPDGYSFSDVTLAIRRHGVARRDLMTDQERVAPRAVSPSRAAIEDAEARSGIAADFFAGSREAKIERIIDELNSGLPVVVSLAWPPDRIVSRVHTLRTQTPRDTGGHAVLIVGYEQTGTGIEDVLFLFRNSYGPRWGMGGYGYLAYEYLAEHLFEAIVFPLGEEA